MSSYSDGLYVLTTWAAAGDVSGATVRANYLNKYGQAAVESLGKRVPGINFGSLKDAFRDAIDSGASKESPSLADINTPLLTVAGETPSAVDLISGVASDVGAKVTEIGADVFSFTKILIVVAGILGVAYILHETGALRKLSSAK